MDVGEGVEANPPMGRNVGWNQNIERENVIAKLRRQVAVLTEVVQCMQPPLRLLTLILILRTLLELLQGKK